MHCNGKCQMMKKLKEEEKKDEQAPDRKAENKNELVLSSKSFYPVLNFGIQLLKIYSLSIHPAKAVKMPRSFFHPPSC